MAGLWLFGTMVAAIALVNGCESAREHSLTYKLWHNEELRHLAQPAVDPKLSLFAVGGQTEILVEYDEDSDSKSTVSRRAYFLEKNQVRIRERQRPEFVTSKSRLGMEAIPLRATAELGIQAGAFAVTNGNAHSFTIYRNGQASGPHSLPGYEESSGNLAKVSLTPIAVAGDAVMVGVVASLMGFYMWAQGAVSASGGSH